jgi:putative DNA methylase
LDTRLIDVAFPLVQTSIDAVHEKNVRHGHISTLHIWPARRPLAACRAALIATLLPDPGTPELRARLVERIGGTVVTKKKGVGEITAKAETKGGVLHWGRENSPDMDWFRQQIREAYGGRAPRVYDPFAGGGAIPLEAMRLGCEVTAADINPVAWFILKCTLEYPQKLAGQTRPLPGFALESEEFMARFRKEVGTQSTVTPKQQELIPSKRPVQSALFGTDPRDTEADLAWHVRAWGWWVLQRARADLDRYYPTVDGKTTVAYLWARTVACKNCRAVIPLLKTRWLCRKDNKRVALTMAPNAERTAVVFGIWQNMPVEGGNNAQRGARDKEFGGGTMSRSGATCPCCGSIMTMEDIRLEARAGRMASVMTAVVVDGAHGKAYRLPDDCEIEAASAAAATLPDLYAQIPFGLPSEPTPGGAGSKNNSSSLRLYGLLRWIDVFTPRQLLALGTIVLHTRTARQAMAGEGYPPEWIESIAAGLSISLDRLADRQSSQCRWDNGYSKINNTFSRFALPIVWDFCEGNPLSDTTGNFRSCTEWVAEVSEDNAPLGIGVAHGRVVRQSATTGMPSESSDLVVTDPPYYDAIAYADLMDFFYIWLRRSLHGLSADIDAAFSTSLAPKWDHEANDGELIDDPMRFGRDGVKSRAAYEDGMFRSFQVCGNALAQDGRMVVVFAHKHPDAWETLVLAIIRAGFVVDGSWPIQTEMGNRTRAQASAALSSSVWLVCKKRSIAARPGWDNRVLEEMRQILHGERDDQGRWIRPSRLHEYWDAGIRGPDFVWAATGPALEAYSAHPVVRKANEPGAVMAVGEFLRQVRRLVVDFVVGRVLGSAEVARGENELDDVTTYYLLHRHDFGLDAAPAGACILYAVSCNLSDRALSDSWDVLARGGKQASEAEEDETDAEGEEPAASSGSELKLKPWSQRKGKSLGEIVPGRPTPLIDQAHRLMRLWKAGDENAVDRYAREAGLRQSSIFPHLLQALIELAPAGSEERSILESISNHLAGRGVIVAVQRNLFSASEPALAGIED